MKTLQNIPVFESGFPLRVNDLDYLFDYLETGERRTRTELVGAGIFYGLTVLLADDMKSLTIKSGAGVTSQGHLYSDRSDGTFMKVKENVEIYPSRFTNTLSWIDGFVAQVGEQTIKVHELVKDTETGTLVPLTKERLENRVVVILFERTSDKRNGCTTCNKGTNANVAIRYLLLKKGDWDKLQLSSCKVSALLTKPTSGFPSLKRFGALGTCVSNFNLINSMAFNGQYQSVVGAAFAGLSPLLENVVKEFAPFFSTDTEGGKEIHTKWHETVLGANATFSFEQYAYDYAKHLIRAYNELVEKPFVHRLAQLPDEICFPKYLSLTQLVATDNKIATKDDGVRLPLYRPPFTDTQREAFDEARFLYARLIEMLRIENLKFNRRIALPNALATDIKITPSRMAVGPLSNRAIPFYFDGAKMRPWWHFNLSQQGRIKVIAAYDRETGAPFNEPFLYQNAFDEADFYRVEGHVGQPLNTVWNTLVGNTEGGATARVVGLRTCLNLPFSVEIVELAPIPTPQTQPKPPYKTLAEFALKNTGLEHQGGVPSGGTLILVVEKISIALTPEKTETETGERDLTKNELAALEKYTVVADFCLPYRVPEIPRLLPVAFFTITPKNMDNVFKFNNLAQHYDTLEWYVDGVLVVHNGTTAVIDADNNLTYTFDFDNPAQEARTFVVSLVAKSNDVDLPPDSMSHGVAITRTVAEPPVADFEIIKRSPIDKGERITFENRSNHATEYTWEVRVGTVAQTDVTQPTLKGDFAYDFKFGANDVGESKTFTVVLIAKSPKAIPNQATAKQEIVITKAVDIVEKPVADFELVRRVPFMEKDEELEKEVQVGETLTFENRSDHASKFTWFINDEKPKPDGITGTEKDQFVFNLRYSEVPYRIRLRATNAKGETNDAEQDVSVVPITVVVEQPIADFEEINRITLNQDDAFKSIIEIEYENRSDHSEAYRWEVLQKKDTIWVLNTDKTAVGFTDKATNFKVRFNAEETRLIFKIRLTAQAFQTEDGQNLAVAEQVISFNPIRPQIANEEVPVMPVAPQIVVPPMPIIPSEIAASIRNAAPESSAERQLDDAAVPQKTGTSNRDFRQKIEDEGLVNTPLPSGSGSAISKTKVYKNTLAFVASFDTVSDSEANNEVFDLLDKQFKTLAVQLANNTKREGGVSDAAYQAVLQNLLYAYLDKLVQLSPKGLSPSTEQTVVEVLQKIKTTAAFEPDDLTHLFANWQAEQIATEQNTTAITHIALLFEDGFGPTPSGNKT